MRVVDGNMLFSASDLMRFMGCAHSTTLDLMYLRGRGLNRVKTPRMLPCCRNRAMPTKPLILRASAPQGAKSSRSSVGTWYPTSRKPNKL